MTRERDKARFQDLNGTEFILDADGADIIFKDAGTEIGRVTSSSFGLKAPDSQNIVFKGNDVESDLTAMTIDV